MVRQLHVCYKTALMSNAENERELYGTTEKGHQELKLEYITSRRNINIDFLPLLHKHVRAEAAGGASK